MNLHPLHHPLVIFLIVVIPIWDRRETARLKSTTDPRARMMSYGKTIAWQLIAVMVLLATTNFATLYHSPIPSTVLGRDARHLVIPICIGLGMGVLIPVLLSLFSPRHRDGLAKQLEPIAFFLPRTASEKLLFAAMCVVVGICEEVIFRGFLIRYIATLPIHAGWLAATIGAAVIFGIDHGYQGWIGILTTTCLAVVFTVVFVASGTLLVPMIGHALLDLRILAMHRKPR